MLERLEPRPGARHRTKRVGRGPGSGHRKTSGRGIKGQGKRSAGRETGRQFEGGQMPLVRRLPKRGFRSHRAAGPQIVNVGSLAGFGDGARVDAAALKARGLVRDGEGQVKVLGEGSPPRNLTLTVSAVSAAAREKIEAAGGRIEIVG
ncbi:MAG TPA: 50S ribosomal protein L15 [Myxococcota bacterium]|jgi:large subunit ribosomal protein L15